MTERWLNDPAIRDRVLADSPIRRPAEPEEIAALVMFLAADQAGVITAAVDPIDGAHTTH
jgi:NAD(P)-dependent dehydrogenase (short-subunit alcohol dehydrogenase family)